MLESLKRMEDVDGLPRLVPMAMSSSPYCTGSINLSIHFVFRHCQLFLCHLVNGNCTAIN